MYLIKNKNIIGLNIKPAIFNNLNNFKTIVLLYKSKVAFPLSLPIYILLSTYLVIKFCFYQIITYCCFTGTENNSYMKHFGDIRFQ